MLWFPPPLCSPGVRAVPSRADLLADAYRRYKEAVEDLYYVLSTLELHGDRDVAVAAAKFKGRLLSGPDDSDWDYLIDTLSEKGVRV